MIDDNSLRTCHLLKDGCNIQNEWEKKANYMHFIKMNMGCMRQRYQNIYKQSISIWSVIFIYLIQRISGHILIRMREIVLVHTTIIYRDQKNKSNYNIKDITQHNKKQYNFLRCHKSTYLSESKDRMNMQCCLATYIISDCRY